MGGRDRQPIRGRGGLCDSSPRSRGRPAQSSCAYDDDDTEISAAGLGKKAALELSNTDQKKWGLPVGNEAIYGLRVALAEVLNREAVRQGLDLHADPRSYAARGIDLTPTKHVGVHAVHMHRRGIASERVAAHE